MNREVWVDGILEKARRQAIEIPCYGSREWEALLPNDPAAVAATVIAAEAWRCQTDPGWLALQQKHERAREAERRTNAAEHARRFRRIADRPSLSEMRQRRSPDRWWS